MIQFLDIEEIPTLASDFTKDFEGKYNHIMKLLYYRYSDVDEKEDLQVVKSLWVELATIYKKRQVETMPLTDGGKEPDFRAKAHFYINKELKEQRHDYEINKLREKIQNIKSDIPEIL